MSKHPLPWRAEIQSENTVSQYNVVDANGCTEYAFLTKDEAELLVALTKVAVAAEICVRTGFKQKLCKALAELEALP
jgi:hypothetical protein